VIDWYWLPSLNAISKRGLGLSEYSNLAAIRPHIPEGLTIVIEAPQRFGKTLSLAILALDAYQHGRSIYTNFQLGFPHEPLSFTDVRLADGASRFWNGFVALDELNFLFDGRRSMSGPNVEFAAWLLQQKKQGCSLAGTTHNLGSLDVRLRDNFDLLIRPRVWPAYPNVPQILQMTIENGPLQARMRKKITLSCAPYLGLYDTFAIYDPFKKTAKDGDEPLPKPGRRVTL
jgi:hypothetical protein